MIRLGDVEFTDEHKEVIDDIVKSGRITEGKYVSLFEREVEKYLGVKHAIAVTNGTVALQLLAFYLGRDRTVCVPALTFPATLNAFLLNGNKVILCDIGEDLQINVDTLFEEDKKEINTIVPVHLMGLTANMDKIVDSARENSWLIIEDSAEAFGASFDGKKVGTIGAFGTFSFFVSHNVWGGELGVIVTDVTHIANELRSMKNHGRVGSSLVFNHEYIGGNYKTNEFCAGLAYVNLKHADEIIKKRTDNARYFEKNIKNKKLETFKFGDNVSFLGFPIKASTELYKKQVCERLNKEEIETRGMFPCLANQPAYSIYDSRKYSVANEMEKRCFYIPIHQYLTGKELKKIVTVLNEE